MTDIINKSLVSDEERADFLPKHCGKHFLQFEMTVYGFIDRFVSAYNGGYWEFYTLSNGGFYMAWDHEGAVIFKNIENYTEQEMSVDAVSIAINLYALSSLSFRFSQFAEKYHLLRDYAAEHAEAHLIFKAID